MKGGGAQNARKERVRVGQLDDEGSGRVLDDAEDSQASERRRIVWHRRAGDGARDLPPVAGAAIFVDADGWSLAGDGAAGRAISDAAADAARSVFPPSVAG